MVKDIDNFIQYEICKKIIQSMNEPTVGDMTQIEVF